VLEALGALEILGILGTLWIYIILVTGINLILWGFLFPIYKRFVNRHKDGPKYLLIVLLVLLGVDTIDFLLSIPVLRTIPMRDITVNIMQIWISPFVHGLLLLSLLPFFSKKAEVFYQYTAIDRECFKKNGVGIEVLKTTVG